MSFLTSGAIAPLFGFQPIQYLASGEFNIGTNGTGSQDDISMMHQMMSREAFNVGRRVNTSFRRRLRSRSSEIELMDLQHRMVRERLMWIEQSFTRQARARSKRQKLDRLAQICLLRLNVYDESDKVLGSTSFDRYIRDKKAALDAYDAMLMYNSEDDEPELVSIDDFKSDVLSAMQNNQRIYATVASRHQDVHTSELNRVAVIGGNSPQSEAESEATTTRKSSPSLIPIRLGL